jgi:hypothetical protein
LPSIFQRTPSRTVAIAPHFQKQRSQKVGTRRRPFSFGEPREPAARERAGPPTAASPADAPAIFRNRRRDSPLAALMSAAPQKPNE